MASACALAMFSGKNIFISRLSRPAGRDKRYFHGWGRSRKLHLHTLPSSPSQALTRQTPPFVTCGDIFPRSGGSLSSKGEPLAKPHTLHLSRKLCRPAKASHFGRGGFAKQRRRGRGRCGNKPSPSSLRDATSPERGRFYAADRQMAKSSPFGGAGKAVRL